jgi:hypothetical protein
MGNDYGTMQYGFAKDMRYAMILPAGKDGIVAKLKHPEEYRRLFSLLAKPRYLGMLIDIYMRPPGQSFTDRSAASRLKISTEEARAILDDLYNHCLVRRSEVSDEKEDLRVYSTENSNLLGVFLFFCQFMMVSANEPQMLAELRKNPGLNAIPGTNALTALSMVLMAVFNLILSWLMQKITDKIAGTEPTPLLTIALWTLAAFVMFILVYLLLRWSLPRFMERAMQQYKEYAFKELTQKSINAFTCESTSKYISALTNDAVSIETNYLAKSFSLLRMCVSFFGALAMMLYYSPLLTAVALGLSLLPVVASILAGGRLAKEEQAVSERNEAFVGTIKNVLTASPSSKALKPKPQHKPFLSATTILWKQPSAPLHRANNSSFGQYHRCCGANRRVSVRCVFGRFQRFGYAGCGNCFCTAYELCH